MIKVAAILLIFYLTVLSGMAGSYNSISRAGVILPAKPLSAVSPDNKWAAFVSMEYEGYLKLATKAHIKVINMGNPSEFFYYYDSSIAVNANSIKFTDNQNLAVFSMQNGKLNYDLINFFESTSKHVSAEPDSIKSYYTTDDVSILTCVDESNTVYFLDLLTGSIKNQIKVSSNFLNQVFFSVDKTLTGLMTQDSVFVFKTEDLTLLYSIGIRSSTTRQYFWGNLKLISYDYDDGAIRVFDMKSGGKDREISTNKKYYESFNSALTDKGYMILTGRRNEVWDVVNSTRIGSFTGYIDNLSLMNNSDSILLLNLRKPVIFDYKELIRKSLVSDNYGEMLLPFLDWGERIWLNQEIFDATSFKNIAEFNTSPTEVNFLNNCYLEQIDKMLYYCYIPSKQVFDSLNLNDYFTGSHSNDRLGYTFPDLNYFVSLDDSSYFLWKKGIYQPYFTCSKKNVISPSATGKYFILHPVIQTDSSKYYLHLTSDASLHRELMPRLYQFSSDDKYLMRRFTDTFEISDVTDGSIIKKTFFELQGPYIGKVSADLKYYVYCLNQSHELKIYNLISETEDYSFTFDFPNEFYLKDFLFTRNLEKCVVTFTDGSAMLLNSGFPSNVESKAVTDGDLLSISPNPATDYIEITILNNDLSFLRMQESDQRCSFIRIYNVFGEEFNPTPALPKGRGFASPPLGEDLGGIMRIDTSSLPPGIYFVRVGEKTGKFVKL